MPLVTEPTPNANYVSWLDDLWSKRLSQLHKDGPLLSVGILLCPGFAMMSLTGIIESLRHAGDFGDKSRQLECRWDVIGPHPSATRSSCGLEVRTSADYADPQEYDYIALVGGQIRDHQRTYRSHIQYLARAKRSGVPTISVCTAAFLLAEHGLIPGRRVCVHPYHSQQFSQAHPGFSIETQQDFIEEDGVITVPGGVSILSLMTSIIRKHVGVDRASKVVHQLSLSNRRTLGDFERTGLMRYINARDSRLQQALVMIESRFREAISVPQIAANLNLSERQLARLFRREVGTSPKAYLSSVRLRYSLWLLCNTNNSISAIAYASGYSSCAHFSAQFRKAFGSSPSSLRKENIQTHAE